MNKINLKNILFHIFAVFFLILSFRTLACLQNVKMTEIFVKSNSLVEVQTYFRIKNFDGNDISNFILIGLILGIAALLIGTIICLITNYYKNYQK